MPDQLPLFGFHDTRPKLKVKKMISATRMKEALASRDKSEKEQISALRDFNDRLDAFEKRLKNK